MNRNEVTVILIAVGVSSVRARWSGDAAAR
jgi:hypothetical protein